MPECLPSRSADFGTVNSPILAEAVGLQRFHSCIEGIEPDPGHTNHRGFGV